MKFILKDGICNLKIFEYVTKTSDTLRDLINEIDLKGTIDIKFLSTKTFKRIIPVFTHDGSITDFDNINPKQIIELINAIEYLQLHNTTKSITDTHKHVVDKLIKLNLFEKVEWTLLTDNLLKLYCKLTKDFGKIIGLPKYTQSRRRVYSLRNVYLNFNQRVKQVNIGERHLGFVTCFGNVYTMGDGKYGKLGNGLIQFHLIRRPFLVPRMSRMTKVFCGYDHTAFVSEYGQLFTLGQGFLGALGNGIIYKHCLIKPFLTPIENVRTACCGNGTTSCVTKSGKVYIFGSSWYINTTSPNYPGKIFKVNLNHPAKKVFLFPSWVLIETEKFLYGIGHINRNDSKFNVKPGTYLNPTVLMNIQNESIGFYRGMLTTDTKKTLHARGLIQASSYPFLNPVVYIRNDRYLVLKKILKNKN